MANTHSIAALKASDPTQSIGLHITQYFLVLHLLACNALMDGMYGMYETPCASVSFRSFTPKQ